MTNHIHFIANAKSPHKLEDILRDFKAHTAKKILELLHDGKTQESRREWLLYLFQYFGKRLKNARHQVWIHDNHPIELYSEAVVIQKLRYIHNNPVETNWVNAPTFRLPAQPAGIMSHEAESLAPACSASRQRSPCILS